MKQDADQTGSTGAQASGAALPLSGLKVLELGHIVAGPTAGHILADMGADVIKIESVSGGDQTRTMPGASVAMFHFLNRNKRSVALDLKAEGRELFLKMAEKADVIIDNFAYGAIEKLKIDFAVVKETNPGVIWLSIKGYLPGPDESRPMLDELAQMAGGLAYMTGTTDKPMRAGASIIDVGAATYGVIAVLGALRQREVHGGQGQHITAGLFETSAYFVAQWMAVAQYSNEPSVPMSAFQQGTRMGFGVYQLFDTRDGDQVFIGVTSDTHWKKFCEAFDLTQLLTDPRFATGSSRIANRPELTVLVADVIKRHSSPDAQDRLKKAGVPSAPLRRPDQLGEDPHLNESGQLMEIPMPNGVRARLPKLPFRADGFDMPLRFAAPALGADTRQALRELELTDAEIDDLLARGVIAVSGEARP